MRDDKAIRGAAKLPGATLTTTEVAALLDVPPGRVRMFAWRRGIRAASRDPRTGEALWPAERLEEMRPRWRWGEGKRPRKGGKP